VCDIAKAARELDWTPRHSVDEGIEKLYRWVSENRELFSRRVSMRSSSWQILLSVHGGIENHLYLLCGELKERVSLEVVVSNTRMRTVRDMVGGIRSRGVERS